MVVEATPSSYHTSSHSLSSRELEILGLIGRGKTSKEIAADLVLSVATVQRHIANIYAKIDVRSRSEATIYALRHGIVGS
jgi:DNA-binding NarL/FixJ family response regulator